MDCDFFLQEKLVASMSREELDPASSAEDAVSDIKLHKAYYSLKHLHMPKTPFELSSLK